MPLYGHELSEQINPFEAGLGFACHLVGYDFPGRDALLRIQKEPLRRVRVGLEMSGQRRARVKAIRSSPKASPSARSPAALSRRR